jgi:hypothetical protein
MADLKTGGGPTPDLPSHVKGIKSGNARGNYDKQKGFNPDGTVTAESATGVNSDKRNPIDPSMPNLPPG